MFTGIVSDLARLRALERGESAALVLEMAQPAAVKVGDSVAVNGACLTMVKMAGNRCWFDLSRETLRLANFADLASGSYLNIELPLRMNDFLSGHLVSGHLDGTVRVKAVNKSRASMTFSFTFLEREWKKFLVHKGSVALNGVSLTITEVRDTSFSVALIPHTLETTNFKYLRVGERVNIELDLIGKYLYNMFQNEK